MKTMGGNRPSTGGFAGKLVAGVGMVAMAVLILALDFNNRVNRAAPREAGLTLSQLCRNQ